MQRSTDPLRWVCQPTRRLGQQRGALPLRFLPALSVGNQSFSCRAFHKGGEQGLQAACLGALSDPSLIPGEVSCVGCCGTCSCSAGVELGRSSRQRQALPSAFPSSSSGQHVQG